MTRISPALCIALASIFATAPGARASDAPPPLPSLRHLTFAVELGVRDEYEKRQITTPRMGLTVIRRPASGTAPILPDPRMGSYDRRSTGTIVLDVVAATSDGGLVVDVSEEATERSAPRLRVAIQPNGHLNFPPSAPLLEEEVALLRLLARSVVGSQRHDIGSSWIIEDTGKGYAARTTFRVTGAPTARDLRLDIDGEYRQEGLDNFIGALQGKVSYDQSKLVPLNASIDSLARRELPEGYRVLRMAISLTLVEDSFARP